jgi:hypothetical protein
MAFLWRVFVFWRWNRDSTSYMLLQLLMGVGVHGDTVPIIYHYIVDEKRWSRLYAAKRLAHAMSLMDVSGVPQDVNELASKRARAVVDLLWADEPPKWRR